MIGEWLYMKIKYSIYFDIHVHVVQFICKYRLRVSWKYNRSWSSFQYLHFLGMALAKSMANTVQVLFVGWYPHTPTTMARFSGSVSRPVSMMASEAFCINLYSCQHRPSSTENLMTVGWGSDVEMATNRAPLSAIWYMWGPSSAWKQNHNTIRPWQGQ